MKKVELSKIQVVGGRVYGPGEVEVEPEIAKRFKPEAIAKKKAEEKEAKK